MFHLNSWRVASLLLSLPSLFFLGAISAQPASAGDYGDYYGGHHRSHYVSSDDDSYYRPRGWNYGPEYGYRSSYYAPTRRYYSDSYGYASNYGSPCAQSVKVEDGRGGWVWGKAYYC